MMQSENPRGLHVAIIMDGNGPGRCGADCPASLVIVPEWPHYAVSWSAHRMLDQLPHGLRLFIRQLAPPDFRGGEYFLAFARLPAFGN